jgi:hypothetical protein
MKAQFIGHGLLFALIIVSRPAAAGPPGEDSREEHGKKGGQHEGDHDGGRHEGHHDAAPPETADQRAERREYVEETVAKEREITKHHIWTPEMSEASWKHWRRAYRALRVRELAQDDHEEDAVTRVDAFLRRLREHFLAHLTELTTKAPEIPPPPTLLSPAAGAQLAVGTAVSFKMAPYKDAAQYYCWFWEPGGHHWSNWQSGTGFGTSPECDVAADDPHWSKFRSGKAEFYGRAIVPAKTSAGKEYKMWSEPVKLELKVTGGEGGSK